MQNSIIRPIELPYIIFTKLSSMKDNGINTVDYNGSRAVLFLLDILKYQLKMGTL